MPAKGSDAYIGFGGETTYGTKGTIDQWLRVVSMSPKNGKPPFISRSRRSRMPRKIYFGQKRAELDISVESLYTGTELWWHALLGSYTFLTGVPAAGTHTHLFTQGSSYPTGISMEPVMGLQVASAYTYGLLGMMPQKLSLDFTEEQPLTETWSFIGQQEDAPAIPSAATFPADDLVLPNQMTTLSIDGSNAVQLVSGSIEINVPRAADRMHFGKGKVAEPIVNGPIDITYQFTMEWEAGSAADAQSQYQNFIDEAVSGSLGITFEGDIITGVTKNKMQIALPESQVIGETPSVQDDGIVQATITGRGTDSTGANALSVTFINDTASQVT